ncbi:MAG: SAM-dependent methyltransferase, partial [Candidatus Dadabacteria bacterium]
MKPKSCDNAASDWALKLFSLSPIKQRKLSKILKYAGDFKDKVCLDIGSDNGVISLLLRRRGGVWHSADLIEETVKSIESLVGERVFQLKDGEATPYPDSYFDLIVVVDYLEHIENDRAFVKEMWRILKDGGAAVFNVPNPKRGVVRWLKEALGQDDAAHGHLRSGYTIQDLNNLLAGYFTVVEHEEYSRAFSELADTAITFALDLIKGKRSRKGTLVTGSDFKRYSKSLFLYKIIYP